VRLGWSVFLLIAACENDPPPPRREPPAPAKAQANVDGAKIEFIAASPDLDATSVIRREAERAKTDGKSLLVYVGAPWCEPCQRFHKAAQAGELDGVFPNLRFVEFDRDRDEARLGAAGCLSDLIPLFAKPDADGRCSAKDRIEGSIKGEGAVAQITPRLVRLVSGRVE
jgi:hypothetical protein